ncbi:MAG: polyprenyl synthetase family protein [Clostridiaceae bacterium]|nr:polyprenyl synthetase family protein [Clostridiaceae bacterium]
MKDNSRSFRQDYDCYLRCVEDDLAQLINGLDVRVFFTGKETTEEARTATLPEVMAYALMSGGKRVRPVLSLATAASFNPDQALSAAVRRLATAVECIHTYSLIHDDLPCMDDDMLRRGLPSVHALFGEAAAVLAGDALLNLAFELLFEAVALETPEEKRADADLRRKAQSNRLRAARTVAAAAGASGMIRGQWLDMALAERSDTPGFAEVKEMAALKTGCLFTAAILSMGQLLGIAESALVSLEAMAVSLGLIFQLRDDILDVTAEQEELGKTIGKDAAQGKATFVTVEGLEKAEERLRIEQERVRERIAELTAGGFAGEFWLGLLEWLGRREM